MKKLYLSSLLPIIPGVILCLLVFYGIDNIFLESRYFNKMVLDSECDFSVPSNYEIVYSRAQGKYAIKDISCSQCYLWSSLYEIHSGKYDDDFTAKFDDSCQAKAYLRKFLSKADPTVEGYE